jgi:hypothetical protein
MYNPDLMVELDEQMVSDIVTALTFHVGEVNTNPYHLSLPAWFIDNTRRGSELVGGQGAKAPNFIFSTLYRLRKWKNETMEKYYDGGKFLSITENPSSLFSI